MKRYFLTGIEIEGFRGINNELSPLKINIDEGKVCSIFAPNASGKSSIHDALCFALKNEIPRLKSLHSKENADDYYINQFHSTGNSEIKLKFKSDDTFEEVEAVIKKDRAGNLSYTSSQDPNIKDFLVSLNHDGVLVDYNIFRTFIDNKPLERGRAFSSLIGLSKISALKQSLDTLTRNSKVDLNYEGIKRNLESTRKEYSQISTEIQTILNGLDLRDIDLTDLATIEKEAFLILKNIPLLEKVLTEEELDRVNFEVLINTLKDAEGGKIQTELINKSRLQESLNLLISKDPLSEKEELERIKELIKNKDELIISTLSKEFNILFDTAKKIFDKSDLSKNQCPLCDSVNLIYDDNQSLYDVVISKLEEYEEVKNLNTHIKTYWTSFSGRQRLASVGVYLQQNNQNNIYSEAEQLIRTESISYSNFDNLVTQFLETDKKIIKDQTNLKIEIENLKSKLPSSIAETFEKINYVQNLVLKINRLTELSKKGKELRIEFDKVELWLNYISNLTKQISKAEAELNKEICINIEADTRAFFKKIINNDQVVPTLTRSSSSQDLDLELETFFLSQNLNATPLLSESYRNALAISIFLASLLRSKPKARFVVFDDISSSFDAGNQLSLMTLLLTEISTAFKEDGLQVIILSHDGLLRKYFNTQASQLGDKWRNIELQGLAPQGRIIINPSDNHQIKNNIIDFLNAGKTSMATPLMRQYLEYVTLDIIKKVKIPVPFDIALKEDNRTISECLGAIQSHIKLTKQANICVLEVSQSEVLLTTIIPSILGNWLSHFETNSIMSLNPSTLLGFMTQINSFIECFKYDKDGGRVFYKSLTQR